MEPTDLDAVYGSLANALARAGEARANLFLATLALDLISQQADCGPVLAAIARAERVTGDE